MDAVLKSIPWSKIGKSLFIGVAGLILADVTHYVLPAIKDAEPFGQLLFPVFSTAVALGVKALEAYKNAE